MIMKEVFTVIQEILTEFKVFQSIQRLFWRD